MIDGPLMAENSRLSNSGFGFVRWRDAEAQQETSASGTRFQGFCIPYRIRLFD